MLKLLERGGNLSAVFAVTDELAIGAMRALYEAGLRVPRDISIIGFDDIDIAAFMVPGLSTVRQPIQEMGRKTAEIMYRLIAGNDCGACSMVFPHDLVIRESCGAI
jgi:LacI family transcriptional regulator